MTELRQWDQGPIVLDAAVSHAEKAMVAALTSPDRYAFKDVSVTITGRYGVVHIGTPITTTVGESDAQTGEHPVPIIICDTIPRSLRIRLAALAALALASAFPAEGTQAFTAPLKLDPPGPPIWPRERTKAQWKRDRNGFRGRSK